MLPPDPIVQEPGVNNNQNGAKAVSDPRHWLESALGLAISLCSRQSREATYGSAIQGGIAQASEHYFGSGCSNPRRQKVQLVGKPTYGQDLLKWGCYVAVAVKALNPDNVESMMAWELERDGFCILEGAVDRECVDSLLGAFLKVFEERADGVLARSERGHAVAARNLLDSVPAVRTIWQCNRLLGVFSQELGENSGLVRALFFDKPPDRTWGLAWHKDTAIAVKVNSLPSRRFSRPTTKSGVPHVIACDQILIQELYVLDAPSDRFRARQSFSS